MGTGKSAANSERFTSRTVSVAVGGDGNGRRKCGRRSNRWKFGLRHCAWLEIEAIILIILYNSCGMCFYDDSIKNFMTNLQKNSVRNQ